MISCVIVLYFFPTSLFTEWVCVYAYTEPLGQHAGISELFLIMNFMYIFSSADITRKLVLVESEKGQIEAMVIFL